CRSVWQTPQAATLTRICPGPGVGMRTSSIRSGAPNSWTTAAFINSLMASLLAAGSWENASGNRGGGQLHGQRTPGCRTFPASKYGQTDHGRCDLRRRWLAHRGLNRLARARRSSFGAAPPFQHRAKSGNEGKRLIDHDMVLRAWHFDDRRSHPHERRYV